MNSTDSTTEVTCTTAWAGLTGRGSTFATAVTRAAAASRRTAARRVRWGCPVTSRPSAGAHGSFHTGTPGEPVRIIRDPPVSPSVMALGVAVPGAGSAGTIPA
ncbi:hypothetical protein JCM9957A_62040 [Kineosporia succinea]